MTVPPKFLLVMRHAEKPEDPYSPDLSPAGLMRAKELVKYIPDTFGIPDFIIASAISKHSARPYETVRPLAQKIGEPIDATIADQDYRALAADLMSGGKYSAKQCVICWHHGNIPSLVRALGGVAGDYPDPWDPEVFNLILKLDFANPGPPKIFLMTEPF